MDKATKQEMEAWNKAVERQSLTNSGFCRYCGEAVKPFVKDFPQELIDTACEYDGLHPDCGNHNMVYKNTTSEVFGSYQIYECTKCKLQEAI